MRNKAIFEVQNIKQLKLNIKDFCTNFQYFSILDSNNFTSTLKNIQSIDFLAAADSLCILSNKDNDSFDKIYNFQTKINDWIFGYISYDVKNELEVLKSENFDGIQAEKITFFQAKFIFELINKTLIIHYIPEITSEFEIREIFQKITSKVESKVKKITPKVKLKARLCKNQYIKNVIKIKEHIRLGDIYEANYCQEFYAEKVLIDTKNTSQLLTTKSPTPFSAFFKAKEIHVISASPERYIKKIGNKIYSQPIKGTIKRGNDKTEDLQLISKLKNDIKERAENIMIVDLVRNDLSKTAKIGSVKLEELCNVHTFPQVHQMISTISSTLDKESKYTDILKFSFPMGSMTGAPKIKAMQLIEKYENTKRGIYSGALGYITPNGDFDFNVIIRTILYNSKTKYLSFMVGSAITNLSDAKYEYEECILKAKAMGLALGIKI